MCTLSKNAGSSSQTNKEILSLRLFVLCEFGSRYSSVDWVVIRIHLVSFDFDLLSHDDQFGDDGCLCSSLILVDKDLHHQYEYDYRQRIHVLEFHVFTVN